MAAMLGLTPLLNSQPDMAEVSSTHLKISYDLSAGTWSVRDTKGNALFSDMVSLFFYDNKQITPKPGAYKNHSFKAVKNTLTVSYNGGGSIPDLEIRFLLDENKPSLTLTCKITNSTPAPVGLQKISPISVSQKGGFLHNVSPDNISFHNNGYQSWDSTEFIINPTNLAKSHWSLAAVNRITKETALLAFMGFQALDSFSYNVRQEFKNIRILATSLFGKVILEPGESRESDPIHFSLFPTPAEAFSEHARIIADAQKPVFWKHVPSGWCTWYYYYYDKVTEEEVIKNAKFAAEHFKPLGMEYIQIDDGFQISAGDWDANEKFPHGMKWLADEIHKLGFKAGLWLGPFIISETSSVFKEHPDWMAKNSSGKPATIGQNPNWGGTLYSLDPSHQDARKWLYGLFKKVTDTWGYDYVKIDFLYYPTNAEMFYDKHLSKAQVYRLGLETIRAAVGDHRFILGCGAPLSPAIGLVNGMRIGPDVAGSWGGVKPCVLNTANRYFMHKKFWLNDPDCLVVRDPLTLDQARAWAAVVALSGGMNLLSDNLLELPAERVELLKRTLPVYGETAVPLDFAEKKRIELPEIWLLNVKKPFETYSVAGIFNWDDKEKQTTLNFKILGLDPAKTYTVYEFWSDTYLGTWKESIDLTLPATSSKVLIFHEEKSYPQIVGTNRHVVSGAVDIENVKWEKNVLAAKSKLVENFPYVVYVRVPKGFAFLKMESSETPLITTAGDLLTIRFAPKVSKTVEWKAHFKNL